jgi:hypothetical protein
MSGRDVAWTTAAATGVGCAVAAMVAAWLLLTNPMAITSALSAHDLGAVAQAGARALQDVAVTLLR